MIRNRAKSPWTLERPEAKLLFSGAAHVTFRNIRKGADVRQV
jgi:hypothetical protein